MKEKNYYTNFIMLIGLASLLYAIYSLFHMKDWNQLLLTMGIMSLVCIFPIKIHDKMFYSFDVVPITILMATDNWKIAIIPALVGILSRVLPLKHVDNKYMVYLFRPSLTLGIFFIAIFLLHFLINLYPLDNLLGLAFLVATNDLLTFVLHISILVSILGRSAIPKIRLSRMLFPTFFILFSISITYEFHQMNTDLELVEVAIPSAFMLFCLSVISKKAQQQQLLIEEANQANDRNLTSLGFLLIKTDLRGTITELNSVAAEWTYQYPNLSTGTKIWALIPDAIKLKELFSQALNGSSCNLKLPVTRKDDSDLLLEASLIPYFRNKKVAAIHIIGRPIPGPHGGS